MVLCRLCSGDFVFDPFFELYKDAELSMQDKDNVAQYEQGGWRYIFNKSEAMHPGICYMHKGEENFHECNEYANCP